MAEYNEKSKVNKEGVIAPDGYHYMPDGTLMADSEHEIQRSTPLSSKRQAFLNKGRLSGPPDCGPCKPLLFTNNVDWYDPATNAWGTGGNSIGALYMSGIGGSGDIARFGDRVYNTATGWCFGPNNTNCTGNVAIIEYEIRKNCSELWGPFVQGTTCSGVSGYTGFGRIFEITNVSSNTEGLAYL